MSTAFKDFYFSFFEDPYSARDGLHLDALRQLAGADRTRAEDLLLDYLPDARGIIGLGELRSARAEPALARLFRTERADQMAAMSDPDADWSPNLLIYLAKALWQIRPDPLWAAAASDVLTLAPEWTQRMTAALALAVIPDAASARALTTALDDPSDLVRHHASRSLLTIHGLPDGRENPKLDREHMTYRVMSDDETRRESGKRDILAAIAGRTLLRR